jgi:hypothetical protein
VTITATETLDRMRDLVQEERLYHGTYASSHGGTCGGDRMCAVGTLWVAAGAPRGEVGELLNILQSEREPALERMPHLRVAYDALNRAAEEGAARRGLVISRLGFTAPLEALFEVTLRREYGQQVGTTGPATPAEHAIMLDVIEVARGYVTADATAAERPRELVTA